MKKLQYRIETAAVRLGLWLGQTLPLSLTRPFGATLGRFAWSVLRVRRRVSLENIRRALGVDEREARRIGRASYENLGRNLMEFIAAPRMSVDQLRRMIRIEPEELVGELLAAGRGIILWGGHYGAWEFIVTGFNIHGYRMHGLVAPQSNPEVGEIVVGIRRSIHQSLIPRDYSLRPILRVLARNEAVGMLGDQDAGRDGQFIPFFGRAASTPRGAPAIAVKQGIPILCGFPTRQSDHTHVLVLERVDPDPALEGDDAVRDLNRRITQRLEAAIRRRPEMYLWAHKRWKSAPPGDT